jgi:hypothetical protein
MVALHVLTLWLEVVVLIILLKEAEVELFQYRYIIRLILP